MPRKPISSDSEQREHDSRRARKQSKLSAASIPDAQEAESEMKEESSDERSPMHGSAPGESAHGAIPRRGIDSDD